MAHAIKTVQIVLEIPYIAGVRDDANIKITQVNHVTCGTTDTGMTGSGGLHVPEGIPETVSAAELGAVGTEGTLLYKLAAVEAAVKAKEGI